MPNIDKNALLSILEPAGQAHVLRFWDSLDDAGKANLAGQIEKIDWMRVNEWLKTASAGISQEELQALTPAPYRPTSPAPGDEEYYAKAIQTGKDLLATGRVAAFTVAGGQGSRLGYDGPKGTYPVTEVKEKTLFQVFAEKIQYAQKKYGHIIPWYLMTSVINDGPTRKFFEEHNYFGLAPENVKFFAQGMLPALDKETGKALLASPDSLALSPNGHGGSFAALKDSGALADMAARGCDVITYWQVDNPMVRPFDPLFLGLHVLQHSDMSTRCLIKRDAKEKLGHFCLLDGKTIIIEYSDMPDVLLQKRDPDGRLSFRAGSPAIHVLARDFIERLTVGKLDFQPHRALKKVPHIDACGEPVTPASPNAIKLEFFLFDALPLAQNPLILEGDRNEEFAPVKNPDGEDSRASSRQFLNARAARLLAEAGIPFPKKADGTMDAVVELSPKTINEAADLKNVQVPEIHPGDRIYLE